MKEIRNIVERYCPEMKRNVVFEIRIGEKGERSERCLCGGECTGNEKLCLKKGVDTI
ncbi:MAG: hypothetical protein J5874_01605 [Oscillospiraceae bacterium]|nr:hypothetical protein [Oscillospiraceae bacterium]